MSLSGVAGGRAIGRFDGLRGVWGQLASEGAPSVAWTRRATLSAAIALIVFAIVAAGAWTATGAVVPWDSKNHFYPMFRHLGDALSQGEIPLWNPYHFGGHPAAADPQSLIFTPTMFLFAWLAPRASMQLFDAVVFAHMLIGALAIVGLFRRRNWRPEGAVLAGMIFMLAGPAASRLQHTGMIISYGYLPLAILLLEVALERASLRFAALFGVVVAFMAVGRDQVAFLSCLALVLLALHQALVSGAPLRWLLRRAGVLTLAGVIAVSLLAIPSLLTMQFLADSNRPDISYGVAAAGSLTPVNFMTMFAPNFFGSINWSYDYWGPGYETTVLPDHTDRAINYLFAGSAVALLLFWQGIGGARLLGRGVRPFLAIGGFALLYAIGRATPVFALIFDALPGVQLYRRPADATFLLNFAIAMGAGYLLHRYIEEGLPRPPALPKAIGAAFAILSIGAVAACVGGALAFSHAQNHLGASLREATIAIAISGGLALLLFAGARSRRRASCAALLVLLTGGELVLRNAAVSINAEPASRYIFDTLPAPQAAGLEALRRELAGRTVGGAMPRVEILGLQGGWQNASIMFNLQNTLGYNPLRISAYAQAIGPGENAVDPNSRKFPATFRSYNCTLAQLLGLEYLVLDRPLARMPRHVPRPWASLVYSGENMYVYRLRDPAPRAYLATTIKPVDSDVAIAEHAIPDFNHGTEALIDEANMAQVRGVYADASGDTRSKVDITAYGANRVVLDVETSQPGVLVLHDLFYPGWTARVDDEIRPTLRANILFRGVEVEAGHHVVTFEFNPMGLANLTAAAKQAMRVGED